MSSSVSWQIQSIKNLSLFDQLELSSEQMSALPKRISKKIFDGFSDIKNLPSLNHSPRPKKIEFAAKISKGLVSISFDGGRSYKDAGALKNFPKLVLAMREIYDAARIQFPGSFKTEEPIVMALCQDRRGSSWAEAGSIGLDLNSLLRNGLSAANVGLPLVALSGFGAGVGGLVSGTNTFNEGKKRYKRANDLGDREGEIQAQLGMSMGLFYNLLSFGMIGTYMPDIFNPFSTDPLLSADPSFWPAVAEFTALALSVALVASTLHEWSYMSEFREDLGAILQRKNITTQTKATQGLEFLQQQLSLSAKDWGDLRDKGLDYDSDSIRDKCLEKYDRLARRIGPEAVAKIAKSTELLHAVKEGNLDAIQQAKDLIELADLESFKKRVREITCLAVAIISMTAIALAFILGGVDPHILYAINAVCWLSVDSSYLHDVIGKAVYRCFKPSDEKRWGTCILEEKPTKPVELF